MSLLQFCSSHLFDIDLCEKGTNFGAKNHSAPLQPQMSMDRSAQTLSLQSNLKAAELGELVYQDYICTNKTWRTSPSSKRTTMFGEGLVQSVYKRRLLYQATHTGSNIFQSFYCPPAKSNVNIP